MNNTLSAAVLLIGNELLSGSIQDINLKHIAITLEGKGIRVRETRIVPDIEQEIVEAVNALRSKYDFVFTTGGIGPTHDDISSDSISAAFGVKNTVVEETFNRLKNYYQNANKEFTPAAQRMAYSPEGATIIHSRTSRNVPCYKIENVFVLAGVPRIMQEMLNDCLIHLPDGNPVISKEVHANISEGVIAESLEKIQNEHPQIDIGSYPQDKSSARSNYKVVFVIRGTDEDSLVQVAKKIEQACIYLGFDAVCVPA